ncbi:MAG: hypothetical protein ACOY4Q_08430 [Bacillota bacterium]
MGDDNNIFGPGEYSLLDRFIGILDRQTDAKLTPNQLMGFLSLFNLLGIINMVHGSAEAGLKDISTLANLTSLAGQTAKSPAGPALKDTLMGLLGGAQNQSGPDLGGLLNMVGGNKKINPQLLLTLMNLLSSQVGSGKSDQHVAKTDAAQEGGPREQAGGEHKEKDRNVELKYDKKKTS